MDKEKDIFETYGYTYNQEVIVPAGFLIGVLKLCRQIDMYQPAVMMARKYPKSEEIRDKDGTLIDVKIEWTDYPNNTAFSNSILRKENSCDAPFTDVGLMSFQTQSALYTLHEQNIKNKIAKKVPETNEHS